MSDPLPRLASALAGRYAIERPLGRGGMATVYVAEDLRHGRKVAIKVLSRELAAALGPERFRNEIRTLAALQHPHIVPLLDSGDSEGTLWYAMPYVAGETLRARLVRERLLAVDETIHICREIGGALEHAHRAGIIHRDVKPDNILLAGGHAVLSDFGVARATGNTGGHLTGTGVVVGTAAYMSPEQAAGERNLDARSDQYALGCAVYEMLGGEPPFSGPSVQTIITKRLTTHPSPLRVLRSSIPPGVEAAVARALARDPAERFPSVADFVAALERSSGVQVSPPARDEIVVAVLPFANLSADPENEYFSDGVTEDIITQLSKIAALKVISRTSVMRFKGTMQSMREVGEALGASVVLEGSVRRAGDRVRVTAQLIDVRTDEHRWAETYDRQLTDIFAIQSDVARSIAGALQARMSAEEQARVRPAPPADVEAYNLYLMGRHVWHRWTEAAFRESIGHFERAIARDPRLPHGHMGLGLAYAGLSLGYWSVPGGAYQQQARSALARALELDPTLAEALAWTATLELQYDFAWSRAESLLTRAIALDPSSAAVHGAYGNFLAASGRHRESRRVMERAMSLDPLSYIVVADAALNAHRARDFERAGVLFERQIALNPELPMGHGLSAWSLVQQGRLDEAVASARRASAIYGGGVTDIVLALPLAAAGYTDEAHAVLQRCEERRATENVWLMALVMAYARLGEVDKAIACLNEAFKVRDFWMVWLKVQPELDPLRAHPRFQRMLEKVRLT